MRNKIKGTMKTGLYQCIVWGFQKSKTVANFAWDTNMIKVDLYIVFADCIMYIVFPLIQS